MGSQGEELRARMMAEAGRAIDRLLEEVGDPERMTLTDIERGVRQAGQRVMEMFTQELAEAGAAVRGDEACPVCGAKAHYKGQKQRRLVTETGEVCVRRDYYYCPQCREGFFPPGSALGVE
ncbi:MAG: hypothetical protein ACPL3S_04025 [Halothiobacillaceae bacterium]